MQRRKDIRKEAERLTAGQINRRRFVMSALATGVTMPTAMSLATKAEALVPRRGGHLSVAMRPGRDFEALLGFATGNTLTEVAGDGRIVGDLARSFTPEQNGKIWVFDLEPHATFADGTRLTASHVVDSLQRTGRARLSTVTRMRASAPDQVVMTLTSPDMTFPASLADPRLIIRYMDDAGILYGSGGYRIEAVEQDQLCLLRRADHWKTGRAHFDAVTLYRAPSAASLQVDVMAGKVQYAAGIHPETTAFLAHLPDVEVAQFLATRALVVHVGGDHPPALAKRTIRALRSGIDRQAFIDRALLGHGSPGNDTPLPPDPATALEARAISDPSPSTSPIGVASDNGTEWLPHLADFATEIGVPLHTDTASESRPALTAATLDTRAFANWISGDLAANGLLGSDTKTTRRIQARLETARSLEDETARNEEIALACNALTACDALFVPAWAHDLAAHSRKLAHPAQMTPNQQNDGHRLIERWWFT